MTSLTHCVTSGAVMRLGVIGVISFIFWANGALAFSPRANELQSGYAIKILKPLPRHNNGCDTIFKNGKALQSCDGNYGFDPEIYGALNTFCRWDLHTHFNGNEKQKWDQPFASSEIIPITTSVDVWKIETKREYNFARLKNMASVSNRHIRIQFNDPQLGDLVCYAGLIKKVRKNSDYYFGAQFYHFNKSKNDPVYSGLSIEDVQKQLKNFIEFVALIPAG